jgi:hypothetical protein
LSIIPSHCNIILANIIKKTVARINAHHIVGVPTLSLCNLKNSVAFPIVASSLICFQSLAFFNKFI